MGFSLTPIPFWSDEIRIDEPISGTHAWYFQCKTLREVTGERRASLWSYDGEPGHYVIQFGNGDFFEFKELPDVPEAA